VRSLILEGIMASKKPKRGAMSVKRGRKDLPLRTARTVKGGSLNAYFEEVTGEKQGKYSKPKA
jgi:hypothetical protein